MVEAYGIIYITMQDLSIFLRSIGAILAGICIVAASAAAAFVGGWGAYIAAVFILGSGASAVGYLMLLMPLYAIGVGIALGVTALMTMLYKKCHGQRVRMLYVIGGVSGLVCALMFL